MRCPRIRGGDLGAVLLIEDKKENLISNLASSWIYEKLVTNVRLSGKITDTKIEDRILTPVLSLITTSPLGHNSCNRVDTHSITSSQSPTGALIHSLIIAQQQRAGYQLQAASSDGQAKRHPGISHTGRPRTCFSKVGLWPNDQYHFRTY